MYMKMFDIKTPAGKSKKQRKLKNGRIIPTWEAMVLEASRI